MLFSSHTSVTSRRSQRATVVSTYQQQSLLLSVAAPQAWNRLLTELKQLRSTASLRQKFKTHLFSACLTYEAQNDAV